MIGRLSPRTLLVGIAVAGVGAVASGLVSQHVFGLQPCPWCILQRMIFLTIAALALLTLTWPRRGVQLAAAVAVDALATAGIAAVLWQHFVAAKTKSCALTLADRIISGSGLDRLLPDVFEVRATCFEAAVTMLGMPYEFWSLAVFVALAAAALVLLLQRASTSRPGARR
jgi:disulfide bond formation protein DsbB